MKTGLALVLTTFLAVALLIACGSSTPGSSSSPTASAGGKLRVVTTIYPVTYFTERVGGARVSVASLVPSGAHAHDFEPLPSHISQIQGANLVIYTHPRFESWMAGVLESVRSNVVAVEAADPSGIPEADGHDHDGESDPHVWLSPPEAALMVERIRAALTRVDPSGAAVFQANAEALTRELEDLEIRIQTGLSSCRLDTVVVSHEAYGHLLENFGIEQVGLAGTGAEQEANPGTLAKIVDLMKAAGIKYVLVEPAISQRIAEQVAATVGAKLLVLHPIETLTSEETKAGDTYFSIMDRNLASLRTALECGG